MGRNSAPRDRGKIPCKARVQHLLIVLMKFGLALCGRDTGGGWDTRGWGLAWVMVPAKKKTKKC